MNSTATVTTAPTDSHFPSYRQPATDPNLLCLQAASEAFGNRIPDEWESMTDEEQEEWLGNNACAANEHLTAGEFFELIDCHADTIKGAIKDALKMVKDGLIEAAIDGTLPSDMNEVDLHYLSGLPQ